MDLFPPPVFIYCVKNCISESQVILLNQIEAMFSKPKIYLLCTLLFLAAGACKKENNSMFTLLEKDETGLDFRNILKETENFNIFKYQYFYNGGGVAVADFDNDGRQDLFFTGNMVKNRLFINQGEMEFRDVTESSGVAANEGWCTGANAVDINNDGWMDIYVCRAGYPFPKLRKNLLLINNGNLTFTDKAAEYGLDDDSYSTHSAFFDYDRDGDLDMFLLNHSAPEYSKGSLEIFKLKNKREPALESKLFRNDGGKFTNVNVEAGISGNVLSLSLGLGVADINNDGWDDVFIGNDFNESDYLFLNNGNGTFTESSKKAFDHTSMFSMGCDIADINNDGFMDMVSLDMLPEGNYLQKMHSGADNYNKIEEMIKNGFQPQFSKNVLQINHGNGSFSECAQMYGVSNTDWSWASLFFDFDNDSYQDLFISNGYLRDHTDMDFLQFTADQVVKADKGENPVTFEQYMASMPPINQPNYFYANSSGKKFENKAPEWGLTKPSVSHGAAYSDLDNDGDLDLVVTNVGDYAYIYKNNNKSDNNYLTVKLKGSKNNLNGIGARVTLISGNTTLVKDLQPSRGFLSTMEQKVFFGLGDINKIDRVIVRWPDGLTQVAAASRVNTVLEISYDPAAKSGQTLASPTPEYVQVSDVPGFNYALDEFNDLKAQGLLPYFLTDRGPACLIADLNRDGLEDFLLTGNNVTPSKLYIQAQNGTFQTSGLPVNGVEISDIQAIDGPNGPDLIVAAGSYKYNESHPDKGVHVLRNNGRGAFTKHSFTPLASTNPSAIALTDTDNDGDKDLIIGGTCHFGKFPVSTPVIILPNKGDNVFTDPVATDLPAGLVTDMVTADINGDDRDEIITCGEWMPLRIFSAENGKLTDKTSVFLDRDHKGLWKTLHLVKDQSGISVIAGNLGLNSQLTASAEHPMKLFYEDYDQNGSYDPILAYHLSGGLYPFAPREDMIKQVPVLNKRFNTFSLYAKATVADLLGEAHFAKAKPLEINTLANSVFRFRGGQGVREDLPAEVQVAPVYACADTGSGELMLAGNQSKVRVKLGRLNGNHGLVIRDPAGKPSVVSQVHTGLGVRGDVRGLATVKTVKGPLVVFGVYDGEAVFYRKNNLASDINQ